MKFVLATLLAVASCSTLKNLVQTPKLNFRAVELMDPGLDGVTLGLNFDVENPNPIGAHLDGLSYKLRLNDRDALAGDFKQGVSVPASGHGSFQVPIRLQYREVFASLEQLTTQKTLHYQVEGQAKIGPFSLPYGHTGELIAPRLPSLSIGKIEVAQLGLSGAKIVAHVNVHNPNAFAIPLDKLRYGLKIGSAQLIEGTAASLRLDSNSENELTLPIEVSGAGVVQSLVAALRGQKADYTLNLAAQVKGQSLNLGSTGKTNVSQ